MYRIKTKFGYYYRQGGRYGRFNGDRLRAEIFCNACADDVVDKMTRIVPDAELEKERFEGHARCAGCTRVRSDDADNRLV